MTENKTDNYDCDECKEQITALKSTNMEYEDANARLEEKITEQAIQLDYLKDENKHMKDVLDENRQLKERINKLEIKLNWQERKTTELQERNDRQYDKLTHLWTCIENKDWETLTKEWEELEEADKKLQEEWKCYNG